MFAETGTTCIRKLRIASNESDKLVLQLRYASKLSAMSLQPPGMPEHAILCIRTLHDPYQQQGNAMQSAYRWEQAVSATLKHLLEHAARPIQGEPPTSADAVLFADRSEMLACLASDWCTGKLYPRWWWQSMFRGQDLSSSLTRAWLDKPEYIPGTLQHLARQGLVIPCIRKLPSTVLSALQEGILRAFALHALQTALSISPSLEEDQPSKLSTFLSPDFLPPVSLSAESAPYSLSSQTLYHRGETRNAVPWQEWIPECRTAELHAEEQALLGISLMLVRAPAIARSTSFARMVRQWRQRELPTQATAGWAPPLNISDLSSSNKPVPKIAVQPHYFNEGSDRKQDNVEQPGTFKAPDREFVGIPPVKADKQSEKNNFSYYNEDHSMQSLSAQRPANNALSATGGNAVEPDGDHLFQSDKETIAERSVEETNITPLMAGLTEKATDVKEMNSGMVGTHPASTIPDLTPSLPENYTRPHISFQWNEPANSNGAATSSEDCQERGKQLLSGSTGEMETDKDEERTDMLSVGEYSQSVSGRGPDHDLAQMPSALLASHSLPMTLQAPPVLASSCIAAKQRIVENGLETYFGGLFYLINIGLYLELYGDFTTPAQPGIPLTIWDFLALLGYRLSGAGILDDPVWDFLALLAGRHEQEPPGTYFEPLDVWRVPVLWLKPFHGENNWQWEIIHERLRVYHTAGFIVLDVPLEGDSKEQLEQEMQIYREGQEVTLTCREEHTPLAIMISGAADNCVGISSQVVRWLDWLTPYLYARLQRALGITDDPIPTLCIQHARVHITATHLDIYFSLAALPIEVRIAGLDRNPGWVPAAGRYVTFYFE